MKNSLLVGENVYLRPLEAGDISNSYISWLNDQDVCKFNSHGVYPYTYEKAKVYIEFVNSSSKDLVLAIIDKKDDIHIGNVALQNINTTYRGAEFAILLGDKNFWGRGLGKEVAGLVINHGFEKLNLHRVYCGVSQYNLAMQKLAKSLGMKEEGRSVDAVLKNGKYSDNINYYLLNNL